MKETCTIDIETCLKHENVWCAATKLIGKRPKLHRDPDSLPDPEQYQYVAHNGVKFDFPVLSRVWDWDVPLENQTDTLLMSKMFDCNVTGGHSLKNLAKLYGGLRLKDDFPLEEFDLGFSDKMGDYNLQDTRATEPVFIYLRDQMEKMGFSQDSIRMEHWVRYYTDIQIANGFRLDTELATTLYTELASRRSHIEKLLQAEFPPIIHQRYSDKRKDSAGNPVRLKDNVEEFNVGSRQQIAKRLESIGVKWKKFTPLTEKGGGGNTIVDENTLKPLAGKFPQAALCLEYLTKGKKASMVEGWLKHVKDDGRVHGNVDTVGAVTSRMTHSAPNVAQADSDEDTRSCWTVEKGHKLVGVDASGLELRMLAHYMNDPDYCDLILNGDIHTANQNAAGLETRNQAKTFIYAFLYGAGDAKIGSIVGGGGKQGKALKEQFLRNTPALAELREKIARISKQGHLPGLDGRRIRVRHEHAALNTLLQSAGAIVMKRALVIGQDTLLREAVWSLLVAQVHDEIQSETFEENACRVGEIYVDGIIRAGEYYDMRIPLDGEAKIGTTWAQTH